MVSQDRRVTVSFSTENSEYRGAARSVFDRRCARAGLQPEIGAEIDVPYGLIRQ